MEQAGIQLIAQGAAAFDADMKSATSATHSFVDATEKGGGRVSKAGQIMTGALREIGALATQAFLQAARATADFVGDSINLAGDFEQGMREFQAVAGSDINTQGLEQFKDLFLDIGKRLPVSTKEVQQAAIEMVKGGIDPAIIAAGGLEQNIQFAAAAMKGDLVGAAEISAKILGGWTAVGSTAAEQAAFLTHSTDMLTKAANASTVDVKELARGIFNAQGIAKVAGVSFDDLTTTLAALSPRFESASVAGNSLKNMIARLQPTTDPAYEAMASLGLITEEGNNQFYDAAGNFVGMSKAGQLLQDSLKGLTRQQQAAVLQQIFGNDAMGAAAGLAELGAKGYEEMAAKIEKANGVAATAALIQGSFNTKLDNAKGSMEALKITIGSALLPVLGELLDNYISPGINAITTFADRIFSAGDPMLAFASAIRQWSEPLGNIAFYLIELARGGEGVSAWLKETPPLFQGFVKVLGQARAAFLMLSNVFDQGGISGLIDQLLSDIGAALPDIQAALLGWGQALIDWIAPYIPPMLDALGDAVNTAWDWVRDQVPQWIAQLGAWGQAFGEWVAPYIPIAIDALSGLVDDAWAWVQQQAPAWGEQLRVWGRELVDWIAPMLPPMLAELGRLGDQFLGWIGDQAVALLAEFQAWKTSFVAWIPGATVQFLAEWPGVLDRFLDWIGESAGPLLLQLGDWALSFIEWIVPMIPGFLLALGGIALAIGAFIAETAVVLNKKVLEWAGALIGWVATDVLPKLPGVWASFWKTVADLIYDISLKTAKAALDIGESVIDGIKEGISDAWSSLTGWLSKKMGGIVDAALDAIGAGSPATEFMPVGMFAVQGIMQGFSDTWPGLTSLVGQLSEDLIGQMEDIGRDMQGAIADSFGATASIDRQIAKNLDAFKDVLPRYEQFTTGALKEAQSQAEGFLDPAEGAKFFAMRSKQILEYAKLQKELEDATTAANEADEAQTAEGATDKQMDDAILARQAALADAERIRAQMLLINRAQTAEISQFNANQGAQQSASQQLAESINDVMKALAGVDLTDEQIKIVDMLSGVWSGLQNQGNARQQAYANPPQMQYPGGGSNTTTSTKTINMPIYTNNSPAALQQSWAILQAGMV